MELADLLRRVHSGDRSALDDAMPMVYSELRKIADVTFAGNPGSGCKPQLWCMRPF